jgi:hypothetical protein
VSRERERERERASEKRERKCTDQLMAAAFLTHTDRDPTFNPPVINKKQNSLPNCSSASMKKKITSSRLTLDVSIVSRDEV